MKIRYSRWAYPNNLGEKKCFYLADRNWNDYGNYTSYTLYYLNEKNEQISIGDVKILSSQDSNTTKLLNKNEYIIFDNTFVSLGQSREYYQEIAKLQKEENINILEKMKDWSTYSKEEQNKFKELDGYGNSLLREHIGHYIIENIDEILASVKLKEIIYKFTYKTQLSGASEEHVIDFDFSETIEPYRNFVLIGKNGVGKTKVLKNLIEDLLWRKSDAFFPQIPNYEKMIVCYYGNDVSLNIENDYRLEKINIKEEKFSNFDSKIEKIKSQKRFEYLKNFLNELLGKEKLDEQLKPYQELSSGHNAIYRLLIYLIETIELNSLIIIDELEVHLHPNILAKTMTIIRTILEDFQSYSIMSTHSSLILQQTPSKSVRLIEREGNYPTVKTLSIECFGESLSNISEEIFDVKDSEAEYKKIFEELKKKKTKKEVKEIFDNKLSFNASIYLNSLYNKD